MRAPQSRSLPSLTCAWINIRPSWAFGKSRRRHPLVPVLLAAAGGTEPSGWTLVEEFAVGLTIGIAVPWLGLRLQQDVLIGRAAQSRRPPSRRERAIDPQKVPGGGGNRAGRVCERQVVGPMHAARLSQIRGDLIVARVCIVTRGRGRGRLTPSCSAPRQQPRRNQRPQPSPITPHSRKTRPGDSVSGRRQQVTPVEPAIAPKQCSPQFHRARNLMTTPDDHR
jgi:hypothetical protein